MKADKIRSFEVRIFKTPLKRPFVTALGRKTHTTNVGLTLGLSSGAEGYGEASSSLALAHLSPPELARCLQTLGRGALGREISCPGEMIAEAWRGHGVMSPAAAAFECALLDAVTAARGLNLAEWFGGKLKTIETDVTLSVWDPRTTAQAAGEASREGFRTFKVKVSGEFAADLARVRAALRAKPEARVILDGNQGMTIKGAMRLVETCLKDGTRVLLLEQPLPKADIAGMAKLTRLCPVPVAADESAATPQDAVRIASAGAAKAINIKVAKSGLLGSLQIAAVARAAGLDLMIGCMAETARGLSASVHMALGTGFFRYVDLDSDHLLAEKNSARGWVRRGPHLSAR